MTIVDKQLVNSTKSFRWTRNRRVNYANPNNKMLLLHLELTNCYKMHRLPHEYILHDILRSINVTVIIAIQYKQVNTIVITELQWSTLIQSVESYARLDCTTGSLLWYLHWSLILSGILPPHNSEVTQWKGQNEVVVCPLTIPNQKFYFHCNSFT